MIPLLDLRRAEVGSLVKPGRIVEVGCLGHSALQDSWLEE